MADVAARNARGITPGDAQGCLDHPGLPCGLDVRSLDLLCG